MVLFISAANPSEFSEDLELFNDVAKRRQKIEPKYWNPFSFI
jgi:hypothetical protein